MHAIEQFTDGTAAFYSHRQPAWHRLGTVTGEALNLESALEVAQLNWLVFKSELPVTFDNNNQDVTLDGFYATYRDHPKLGIQGLGVVGERYTVVQNHEVGQLAGLIVDESGGTWETMGSLHGGRKIFMTIKLPSDMTFDGQDPHELYLVMGSSHDGSMGVTAIITTVRVVCQNTWNLALRSAKSRYTFRHTTNVNQKVTEARQALRLSYKYNEEFEKLMKEWLSTPVTLDQFVDFSKAMFPTREHAMSPIQVKRAMEAREVAMEIYMSPTQDFGRGSKYGVFNAFTEYDQWYSPVKAKESKDANVVRAERIIFDTNRGVARRAFTLLSV